LRPQGKASQLHVLQESPSQTVIALVGTAQFDVVHDESRQFRVETAGVAVEVLGTRFLVEELGANVRVTVQQGVVHVLWAASDKYLGAGQSELFPRQSADASAETPASLGPSAPAAAHAEAGMTPGPARAGTRKSPLRGERATPPSPAESPPAAPVPPPASSGLPSWQALAHEGQFEQAYRITYGPPDDAAGAHHGGEPSLLREREVSPGDLLLLADVARLSHHPADAVAPLSRLLREHAADPRAPLAAFTLGRVLLDDLGRPREAAQSFVRAQQLDPDGPLSQDALAREVEAWSRAGEGQSARARALQYVQKYPAGRRLRSVRHFGELL
jgi:transmembrane sensor